MSAASSIDQVIARARSGDASLAERRSFTIARSRAIEKMRNFALASPYDFALELIQAAIANGATYVDITSEAKFFAIAYVGGGFAQDELAQLFDFLFADKSDMAYSALRQLALGVNALMRFDPKEIVITSGDGTYEGTTQITIRGQQNTVEVGRPTAPLNGTFVRVAGLNRLNSGDYNSEQGGMECQRLLTRCLAAPVPLLVNNDPIYGYSTMRYPALYGYDRVIKVEEGDLYGTLGIASVDKNTRIFNILTYGVLIQSFDYTLVNGYVLGGVITFDRLNKTADHAAIVKDDRFAELWARLLPYANQLIQGKSGKQGSPLRDIYTLSNQRLTIPALREILAQHKFVICIEPDLASHEPSFWRAQQIAESLGDAVVLRVHEQERELLRRIASGGCEILELELSSDEDLRFYLQPEHQPPAKPWLLDVLIPAPLQAAPLLLAALAPLQRDGGITVETVMHYASTLGFSISAEVDASQQGRAQHIEGVGQVVGTIQASIYTPATSQVRPDLIEVEIISANRLVWRQQFSYKHGGYVISLQWPGLFPRTLQEVSGQGPDARSLGELVAQAAVLQLRQQLEDASWRVLEGALVEDFSASSPLAWRALAMIAQEGLLRLRKLTPDAKHADLSLMTLKTLPIDVLAVPLFETLAGQEVSLREVLSWMPETMGLVYGVVESVEPVLDGLDQRKILRLSEHKEQLLVAILGESAYVRIDAREFIASNVEPLAHLRDLAVGLKAYSPSSPLFIEHATPEHWSTSQRDAIIRVLVYQLKVALQSLSLPDSERRQALRHLQYACIQDHFLGTSDQSLGLEDLPLFLDASQQPLSLLELLSLTSQHERLLMSDGYADDKPLLQANRGVNWRARRQHPPSPTLAMNPYVFYALREHLPIQAAFDFDLNEQEARAIAATPQVPYLLDVTLDEDGVSGRIGVPMVSPARHSILALLPGGRLRALDGFAQQFGLVGQLNASRFDDAALGQLLRPHAQTLLVRLIELLPTWAPDSPQRRAALETLLHFAAQSLSLNRAPSGKIIGFISSALAQRVFDLPLFDTAYGMPVTAQSLLDEFCCYAALDSPTPTFSWRTPLAESPSPMLRRWLDQTLSYANIFDAPKHQRSDAPSNPRQPTHQDALDDQLSALIVAQINALRADDDASLAQVFVIYPNSDAHQPLQQYWLSLPPDEWPPMIYTTIHQRHCLLLYGAHPLVAQWRSSVFDDPTARAWMLLAAYALINEQRVEVTNEHELHFQRAVWMELLKSRSLA